MGAIISYPDNTLTAEISGGSWQPAAPITNLNAQLLSKVARSTDTLAASSTALISLNAEKAIRVLGICNHNMTATGRIRISGYADAYFQDLLTDTGEVSAWPEGFTAAQVAVNPNNWTFVFPEAATAQYWKVEIIDTGNPAGYIQIGRCFLGENVFEPVVSQSYGQTLGYEARDVITESLGGNPWGQKRTPRRALAASFQSLTAAEKRGVLVLQKTLTTTDECYWVTDGNGTADDMLFETFPCFMRKASPLSYPFFDNYETAFEIIEEV